MERMLAPLDPKVTCHAVLGVSAGQASIVRGTHTHGRAMLPQEVLYQLVLFLGISLLDYYNIPNDHWVVYSPTIINQPRF